MNKSLVFGALASAFAAGCYCGNPPPPAYNTPPPQPVYVEAQPTPVYYAPQPTPAPVYVEPQPAPVTVVYYQEPPPQPVVYYEPNLIYYYGPHPVSPGYGYGWCPIGGVHTHNYEPAWALYFDFFNGYYFFYGDPSPYGQTVGVTYVYYDMHPEPWGGWCYIHGNHRHHYAPRQQDNYHYTNNVFRYGGQYDHVYYEHEREYESNGHRRGNGNQHAYVEHQTYQQSHSTRPANYVSPTTTTHETPMGHDSHPTAHDMNTGNNNTGREPMGHENTPVGHENTPVGREPLGHETTPVGHETTPVGHENQPVLNNGHENNNPHELRPAATPVPAGHQPTERPIERPVLNNAHATPTPANNAHPASTPNGHVVQPVKATPTPTPSKHK